MSRRFLSLALLPVFAGCVEQTMTIKSDPPGSLVYLNDVEVGRTPVTRDFTWYGDYEVEVRKEGYQTLKTHQWVKAPGYLWVPFDLIMELQPATVKDHHDLFFKLEPAPIAIAEPAPLLARAEELKGQLESSRVKKATTAPTTTPTSQAAKKP